jgi:hypothetical protein
VRVWLQRTEPRPAGRRSGSGPAAAAPALASRRRRGRLGLPAESSTSVRLLVARAKRVANQLTAGGCSAPEAVTCRSGGGSASAAPARASRRRRGRLGSPAKELDLVPAGCLARSPRTPGCPSSPPSPMLAMGLSSLFCLLRCGLDCRSAAHRIRRYALGSGRFFPTRLHRFPCASFRG